MAKPVSRRTLLFALLGGLLIAAVFAWQLKAIDLPGIRDDAVPVLGDESPSWQRDLEQIEIRGLPRPRRSQE